MKTLQEMPIWFKLVGTMSLITLVAILIVSGADRYAMERNLTLTGRTTASAISNQIEALRSFYTENVVQPALKSGMDVGYDFAENEEAIPLPATLVKVLGQEISTAYPGTSIRLYSRYAFPHRRAQESYDAFELNALKALEIDPQQPFYRLEMLNGRQTMRYAVADINNSAKVASDGIRQVSGGLQTLDDTVSRLQTLAGA